MSIILSTLAKNNAGNSVVDLIDIGSSQPNGYLELRTGPRPASPAVTATGTLLAICSFSLPAFPDFANGGAIANPLGGDDNINASGVPTWFRIYSRDGTPILDGSVGLISSGNDIEFDSIDFIQGGSVAITSMTVVIP